MALALFTLTPVPQAQAHATFRALLFTEAVGYVHESIPAGIKMFQDEAEANHYEVVQSNDSAVFNDANLAGFDVIVMLQNSGMVWDTEAQRQALQKYVHSGKGIVALHNATDMGIDNEFPWWDDLVNGGAHMPAHSPGVLPGTAKVADRVHPSTKDLPERWSRSEEWYNFDKNPRGNVHVLVTADESTYDPGPSRMGADHPISWCRNAEGGRVWATAMGHTAASYAEPDLRKHIIGGLKWAAGNVPGDCGPTVWSSFEKVALDENTVDPMQLSVAPDGRVFYIQRAGEVKVYKPDTHSTVTAARLDVYTGGEDGLVGMVLDPGFAQNRWIYLYHAPRNAATDVNRLSRFTVTGDTIDPASEKTVIEVPAYRDRTFPEPGHTGGALDFGPDGSLYLGTGDDTPPNLDAAWQGYAPLDWRPGRSMLDAARTAGNTNDLRGKILRIRPKADGGYDIPTGNLFAPGTDKTRPEVYAMGFRNPFRFRVDQGTGRLHVADYGPDRGLPTTDRGPEGLVEYNVVAQPGNFGWPFCHGNNQPYAPYNPDNGAVGAKFDCAAPTNPSPNNTGLTRLPAVQMPQIWYGYGASPEFPEMGSGGSAPMAGPVYRYDPNNPSTTKFPAYYDGAGFFYEWARGFMREIRFDASNKLHKINDFLPTAQLAKPMDMTFGPDGSMYVLDWGRDFGGGNNDSGLYRIDYTQGRRQPVAVANGTPTNGPAPLTVAFSGNGTHDPNNIPITYAWDFESDGTIDSTEPNPTHVYTTVGAFNAQLKVTNTTGDTGFANVSVTVGNTAPTIRLDFPADGGFIEFGDRVPYKVTVTDPEDGTIDCTKVVVNPALGHDDHAHHTTDIPGCEGTIDTGDLGGHPEGANLYYIVSAKYTDKGATGAPPLTSHTRAILHPRHKQAEYFTAQSGTRLISEPGAENGKRLGDISDNDWIMFDPANLAGTKSLRYRLSSPTGGGSIEVRADSPTGTLLGSTPVPATGGWNDYRITPGVPLTALAGTHKLYVVFKTPTNHAYDLDAVLFDPEVVTGDIQAGLYTLTAEHSGKNMTVQGASSAESAPIVQQASGAGKEQKWQVDPVGDGSYTIKSAIDGKCLEVPGWSGQLDVQLVQYTCNNGGNQHWKPTVSAGTGTFALANVASKLCADVAGVGTQDGAKVVQWTCNGAANQNWKFTKVATDTQAPVTNATPDPAQPTGKDGWYTAAPVNVTLAGVDEAGGSGVASTEYDLDGAGWAAYDGTPVSVSGDGEHKLRYRSKDKAGNTEEGRELVVRVDATAPLTTAGFAAPGDSGWHRGAIPVTLTAVDASSKVAGIEFALDGGAWTPYSDSPVSVSGDGEHVLRYRGVDRAGLVEPDKAATIKIDGTKPVLLVAGVADGAVYGDAQDVRVSWEAIDPTSGVKTLAGTLDAKPFTSGTVQPLFALSLGQHTVDVSATDNAGNTTATAVRFTVTTSMRDMQNLVDRFRSTGWLSATARTKLTRQIEKARVAEAQGRDDRAIAELGKLKTLVADPKVVPNADVRTVITRDANRVIADIEG
ncbi:ThuA domain-containing protein (plasmid) [Embleya sp. NBC_00888]|nr:ThuA domain-containing protein [Embleya sp. NBC_00888]